MSIVEYKRPVYSVQCDRCDIDGADDYGLPIRHDTDDAARRWALDQGWQVPEHAGEELLCPTASAAPTTNATTRKRSLPPSNTPPRRSAVVNAPVPSGCRNCGILQCHHAPQYTADGSHTYEPPTRAQRLARMKARRAARQETRR